MLFPRDDAEKRTDILSGGEAARLLFCKLMLQKPNLLVLDEPTNHLDLESITRSTFRCNATREPCCWLRMTKI